MTNREGKNLLELKQQETSHSIVSDNGQKNCAAAEVSSLRADNVLKEKRNRTTQNRENESCNSH